MPIGQPIAPYERSDLTTELANSRYLSGDFKCDVQTTRSSLRHLWKDHPFQNPSRTRAFLFMNQCMVHAGKLCRIEPRVADEQFGKDWVLLVVHGR